MYAHPVPVHRPTESFDLLDEEFDNLGIKQNPFRRPVRQESSLQCDGATWDDSFDADDMMCELQG